MKLTYKNQEVNISIFDLIFTNYTGNQEVFSENGIAYNLGVFGSENSVGIKVLNKAVKVAESHADIQEEAREILVNVSSDVRVAMTNKSAVGRQGNTAVPWYSAFGKTKTPAKTMLIGVHLLNPEGDVYHKEVKLPDNCKLIQATWDFEFAPVNNKTINYVSQIGNILVIHCKKVNCSTADFNRLVPLYIEFDFDTASQEPVTVFGTPYFVCEIPEIFGAYWRKKC